jgi:hypothetical protein
MGAISRRPKFDPADLELIDRVYAVACAYIEARDLLTAILSTMSKNRTRSAF